jgi:predicted small lipoprotein YifL
MLRPLSLAVVCLALAGCGRSYEGPQRLPLSGKVTYDGEAVDAGTISFLPQSGEQRVSGGQIESGAYSVPEEQGANAGKYRVEIHWHKKTGKQFRDADLDMMLDERKEGLPPRFHRESELTVEVSPAQTTFDFHLQSK